MIVKAVGVVEVEPKRVDVSGSDSTKVLFDELDVDNFAKNFFRSLYCDVSCHVEL